MTYTTLFYITSILLTVFFFPGTLSWKTTPYKSGELGWKLQFQSYFTYEQECQKAHKLAHWLLSVSPVNLTSPIINPKHLLDETEPMYAKLSTKGFYVCVLGIEYTLYQIQIEPVLNVEDIV